MRTPVCELLGIDQPVVQAPIADIVAELTSRL
jgi:hypothetical protein